MQAVTSFGDRARQSLYPEFVLQLIRSPKGRAFHLNFMVDAEEGDEGVFDDMLSRVEDPVVQKMVRTHSEDEKRHASLLRGCVARCGASSEPVPSELRYIQRIDGLMGGAISAFRASKGPNTGIMEAYAMLQVVEERGVQQFPFVQRALLEVDPQSAAVLAEIICDEERHVKYAEAVSRRYAPDTQTLSQILTYCRQIEARAFAEYTRAYFRFALDHDLLAVSGVESEFWRAAASLPAANQPS